MDSMYTLVAVLGAVGLGSLGTFLLLSIKDIKKKQDEVEVWKTRLNERTAGTAAVAQNTGVGSDPALAELQRQVAAINARLQFGPPVHQWHTVNPQSDVLAAENRRLLDENRQLRDEIVDLELWLHRTPVSQSLADARRHKLEQELAALESESRAIRARLAGKQDSGSNDSIEDRLATLEKLYADAVAENIRLRDGIGGLRDTDPDNPGLRTQSRSTDSIFHGQGTLQSDPYPNVERQNYSEGGRGKVIPWPIEPSVADEEHPEHVEPNNRPSFASGVEELDNNQSDAALRELEKLLRENPENRELNLYHLLVTVHLRGVAGCEKRIDAIKDMAGLNPVESKIARELFIARADAAAELGDRAAMQNYRRWADVFRPASERFDATELFVPAFDSEHSAQRHTASGAAEKKSWLTDPRTGSPISLRYAAGIGLVISTGIFSVLFAWVTMFKPATTFAQSNTKVASAEVAKHTAAK